MPRIPFDDMPEQARIWIFAADRPVTSDEQEVMLRETDAFLDGWVAHGVPLTNARELRYDRFLLVAVDETASGVSGCSIDAMVNNLKSLERQLALRLLDSGAVQFRSDDGIRRLARPEFASLVDSGDIGLHTTVFNNTVTTVGDVRGGRWETAASESWHAQAFF